MAAKREGIENSETDQGFWPAPGTVKNVSAGLYVQVASFTA